MTENCIFNHLSKKCSDQGYLAFNYCRFQDKCTLVFAPATATPPISAAAPYLKYMHHLSVKSKQTILICPIRKSICK